MHARGRAPHAPTRKTPAAGRPKRSRTRPNPLTYPVFCMPAATPFMQMMRQSSMAGRPRRAAPSAPYPVFCMPAATPFMQMMRQSSTAAL